MLTTLSPNRLCCYVPPTGVTCLVFLSCLSIDDCCVDAGRASSGINVARSLNHPAKVKPSRISLAKQADRPLSFYRSGDSLLARSRQDRPYTWQLCSSRSTHAGEPEHHLPFLGYPPPPLLFHAAGICCLFVVPLPSARPSEVDRAGGHVRGGSDHGAYLDRRRRDAGALGARGLRHRRHRDRQAIC